MTNYRQVGQRLGAYIRENNPNTQQIHGLLADMLAGDGLLPTMREVVVSPEFTILKKLAGSGRGSIHRDELLKGLEQRYLSAEVSKVGQLISGMMDLSFDRSLNDIDGNALNKSLGLTYTQSNPGSSSNPTGSGQQGIKNNSPEAGIRPVESHQSSRSSGPRNASRRSIAWTASIFVSIISAIVMTRIHHNAVQPQDSGRSALKAKTANNKKNSKTEIIKNNAPPSSNIIGEYSGNLLAGAMEVFSSKTESPLPRGCQGFVGVRGEGAWPDKVYAGFEFGSIDEGGRMQGRNGEWLSWGNIHFRQGEKFMKNRYQRIDSMQHSRLAWQVPGYNVEVRFDTSQTGYESSGGYGTMTLIPTDSTSKAIRDIPIRVDEGC